MKNIEIQDSVLLSTKLKMPAPRKNYVIRQELFTELKRSCDMKVIYIMGGAGTGKTTLLSSYIKEADIKNIAWLSLDEANDNIFYFWHYFCAAVGNFLGSDKENILSLFRSNFEAANMEKLLTIIINKLSSKEDYYVVLDDMHYIKDNNLIKTINFFLKSMPDNLHIFMLSRENTDVYLGEFAVSGNLLFIDGDKLQFSQEEGLLFLKETLKLSANDEMLEKMNAFAEGWIGGLQLVAAAGGAHKELAYTARNGIAADYLTREIFKSLSEEEQRFLIITCIPSYFDEEISRSITDVTDFHTMLENLMNKNLFIICIDEEHDSYRYHNILGEYLRKQFLALPKEEQTIIIQKASKALLAKGDKEEAFCLLLKSEDFNGAVCILKDMDETVETWALVNKLPLNYLISDINLSFQCVMYNIGNLNSNRIYELCNAIEKQYDDEMITNILQFIYFYAGNNKIGFNSLKSMTIEQIESLNLSKMTQSIFFLENANLLLDRNEYYLSEQFINKAIDISGKANVCVCFYALATKAQLLEEVGRFNECLDNYSKMEEMLNSPSVMNALGYNYFVGSIGLYYKRMDKERAINALDETNKIIISSGMSPKILKEEYDYHISEFQLLFEDEKQGAQLVNKMLDKYNERHIFEFVRLLNYMHANNLLEDYISKKFIEEYKSNNKNIPIANQLLYARIIAQNGDTNEAMKIVENVLSFSRQNKNQLRLIEADLLKVRIIAPKESKNKRTINNLIREAIYYAWENHIVQPFFTDRVVLLPLLMQFYRSSISDLCADEQKFLREVINLCSHKDQKAAKSILSSRELEVLLEISKGLTNPEIADKLCISLSTVKTHIINIFSKLGVASRLMAIEEAKSQGII